MFRYGLLAEANLRVLIARSDREAVRRLPSWG